MATVHGFCIDTMPVSLAEMPGVQLPGPRGECTLHFLFFLLEKLPGYIPEWLSLFTFPPATCERCCFSASSPALGMVTVCYFSCTNRCVVTCHRGLSLHSRVAGDVDSSSRTCLPSIHPLRSNVSRFPIGLFVCGRWVLRVLHSPRSPLPDTRFAQFSPSLRFISSQEALPQAQLCRFQAVRPPIFFCFWCQV